MRGQRGISSAPTEQPPLSPTHHPKGCGAGEDLDHHTEVQISLKAAQVPLPSLPSSPFEKGLAWI